MTTIPSPSPSPVRSGGAAYATRPHGVTAPLPARPRPQITGATLLWMPTVRRTLWRWQRCVAPRRGTMPVVWC